MSGPALTEKLSTLPLRADDPVSVFYLLKVILVTLLVLGLLYWGLVLIKSKFPHWLPDAKLKSANRKALVHHESLRLSPKLTLHWVKLHEQDYLVAESQSAVTLIESGHAARDVADV